MARAIDILSRMMRAALIAPIRLYQILLSPWFGRCCRFYPSCSVYAIEAIRRHGCVRGLGLAVWRLLRCNPLCHGGVDHVPVGDGKERICRSQ